MYLYDIPPTPTSSKVTLPLRCIASSALLKTPVTGTEIVEWLFSLGFSLPERAIKPRKGRVAGVVEIYAAGLFEFDEQGWSFIGCLLHALCSSLYPGFVLFHNGANMSLAPTDGVFLMDDVDDQYSSSPPSLSINLNALSAKDAQLKERQAVYREEEMQGQMLLSAYPEQVRIR